MVRTSAWLTLLAVTLFAQRGGAENYVTWTAHVGDVAIALPVALFKDRPLPMKGERWHCFADKVLRQDGRGNTYSTLTVHCTDGETTVSSSASCAIGGHDTGKLSLELQEKTASVRNALGAECDG